MAAEHVILIDPCQLTTPIITSVLLLLESPLKLSSNRLAASLVLLCCSLLLSFCSCTMSSLAGGSSQRGELW